MLSQHQYIAFVLIGCVLFNQYLNQQTIFILCSLFILAAVFHVFRKSERTRQFKSYNSKKKIEEILLHSSLNKKTVPRIASYMSVDSGLVKALAHLSKYAVLDNDAFKSIVTHTAVFIGMYVISLKSLKSYSKHEKNLQETYMAVSNLLASMYVKDARLLQDGRFHSIHHTILRSLKQRLYEISIKYDVDINEPLHGNLIQNNDKFLIT